MYIKKDQTIRQVLSNVRGGPGEMIRLDWAETLPPHVKVMATIILEPGSGIGYHTHDGETEVFYILEGELEIDDNGTVHTVRSGDIVVTGGGDGHSAMNTSTTTASMIAVITND